MARERNSDGAEAGDQAGSERSRSESENEAASRGDSARRDVVRSFSRGLSVILAFGPDRSRLTLSDVARITGLTRAAARRFLLTLAELDFVGSDGGMFWLKPRVLELGFHYLSSLSWWNVALPHMEKLGHDLDETCCAAVLDRNDVVCVARSQASHIVSINLSVGGRLPAYATAMGRVLLAHSAPQIVEQVLATGPFEKRTPRTVTAPTRLKRILAKARAQGYSFVDQELELGVRAIAVPIFDRSRQVVGALNVETHSSRFTKERMLESLLPALLSTAHRITQSLLTTRLQAKSPRVGGRVPRTSERKGASRRK